MTASARFASRKPSTSSVSTRTTRSATSSPVRATSSIVLGRWSTSTSAEAATASSVAAYSRAPTLGQSAGSGASSARNPSS